MKFTQLEVDAYNARQNAVRMTPETGCEHEADLHADIKAECRRRGWIALHGSMAHKAKRTEGEPDFIILGTVKSEKGNWTVDRGADSPRVLFIECKTRTGKLSVAQNAMQAHAAKLGHTIHVVRSFEDFLKIIS